MEDVTDVQTGGVVEAQMHTVGPAADVQTGGVIDVQTGGIVGAQMHTVGPAVDVQNVGVAEVSLDTSEHASHDDTHK